MASRLWEAIRDSFIERSPAVLQASFAQRLRAYAFGLVIWLPLGLLAMILLEWVSWPVWPAAPLVAGLASGTAENRLRRG